MRIRRARTLILSFEGWQLTAFNFLTRQTGVLDEVDFVLLSLVEDWSSPTTIYSTLWWYDPYRLYAELDRLMDLGFLVVEGTAAGNLDIEYESQWAWGAMAGYYHFGIKDPSYMNPEDTSSWLVGRVATLPLVSMYQTNDGCTDVMQLPPPRLDNPTLSLMKKRRSYRGFHPVEAVSLEDVSDCLFSGFGITGFLETPIPGEGYLPLKMTPSGGARNPYEGFLYARRVHGLSPGFYHYSAIDNSLALVNDQDLPNVGRLLADQPWFDNAAAVILLVANFERTMWKYPHPTGFRVVLLEAGHIAQNILLTATALGLASAPTCAINDSTAQSSLGLTSLTKAALYTVSLGIRSDTPTQADVVDIVPNPNLP